MKHFNEMTQRQMAKTNGGLIYFLAVLATVVVSASLAAGVGAAAGTKAKQSGQK